MNNTPRVHIIGIIKPISEDILNESFLHYSRILKIPNLHLPSKNWGANLTSLITSTYPSYHGIWTDISGQSLGMHVYPLTRSFQSAQFIITETSEKSNENLLNLLGFKTCDFNQVKPDRVIQKSSISIELISSLTPSKMAKIHKYMRNDSDRQEQITILIPLEINGNFSPVSAYCSLPKNIKYPKFTVNGFHSVLDIAPTIIRWLKLKLPYPWVGHNLSQPQKFVLIEESNRISTLVTSEYRMTIDKDKPGGLMYHLPSDPEGKINLWNNQAYAAQKMEVLMEFSSALLGKEPMPMPRIAGA